MKSVLSSGITPASRGEETPPVVSVYRVKSEERQHITQALGNSLIPEVSNDEDGHQQRAEGHSVANGIHDIQPLKEVLLRTEKYLPFSSFFTV